MSAVLSADGVYRYHLTRDLPHSLDRQAPAGSMCFVMLNPSTADADRDDPTMERPSDRSTAGLASTVGKCRLTWATRHVDG